MSDLNYDYESQKKHIEIGLVYYQDSEKNQLFVAKLELFGNGYDISIYEEDKLQYVQRSVVLNTSYEFLQDINDSNNIIVKVNDEIFVMNEQQFELIKTYYNLLKNDTSIVNMANPIKNAIGASNYKSADEYFNEDDELFYVYDEILRDPKNIRLRVKLAYHLMDEILYFERIKTVGDLSKYMSLCEDNLIVLSNINSGKDKRLLFVKLVAMSGLGCIEIFK